MNQDTTMLVGTSEGPKQITLPVLVNLTEKMNINRYKRTLKRLRNFVILFFSTAEVSEMKKNNPRYISLREEGTDTYSFLIFFGEKKSAFFLKVTVGPTQKVRFIFLKPQTVISESELQYELDWRLQDEDFYKQNGKETSLDEFLSVLNRIAMYVKE